MKEENETTQYKIDERTEIAGDIKDRGTETENTNNYRRTDRQEQRET
jgi:hypothetical protein